ncbi:hypothetical protein [Planosporangium mesophilum]|nr:hypothetical protein [Planosporangium mesophilum]NJC81993.1 hypothetical protein [Planosporangium mesophilum]
MRPLVVEVDGRTWRGYVDRSAEWLETATLLQATYRKLLEDTVEEVADPRLRDRIGDLIESARRHEALINELYVAFSEDELPPSEVRASMLARTREVVARVEGLAAGARGGDWRNVRELTLTNLDSTNGFAVIEQLALAMGLPAVVDLVQPVIAEKTRHQLALREYLLEAAPKAVLYRPDG